MAQGAALVLVACVTGLHAYYFSLREKQQSCGFGHYGTQTGTAHRLVVTHLTPGVADWNVAVPTPPQCTDAKVTGVDTAVCDADVAPEVSMHDLTSARVHRRGQLAELAAVNVTVYCVHGRSVTRYSDEQLSNELTSKEDMSNEDSSQESGLTTSELMPKVKTTSSTVPPPLEVTTPQIKLTSITDKITPSPKKSKHVKEFLPNSLKVMIKITPPFQNSSHKKKTSSYEVNLPSLSYTEKPHDVTSSQDLKFSTPPRNSMISPRHQIMSPPYGATPPHYNDVLPSQYHSHAGPHDYASTSMDYAAQPSIYGINPPQYMVTSLLRPVNWLRPQTRYWRQGPMMFFPRF